MDASGRSSCSPGCRRALGGEPPAHVIGLTGPPGAGKSSLLSALVAAWRGDGRTVAVLAVDPSSKRSGGSLLGDRARIEHDPKDDGVLIRSTAAGGRLGGLAPPTREAAEALAPAFDIVVIETVGVGQSETDVEQVCDTTAVVVQPASGDTLQFLKAGIMEVPDVLVVTKADLGDARAARPARPGGGAALAGQARHAGGGGVVDSSPGWDRRAGGGARGSSRGARPAGQARRAPGAWRRCPSSRPSGASGRCGRSGGAARRSGSSPSRARARRARAGGASGGPLRGLAVVLDGLDRVLREGDRDRVSARAGV